MTVIIATVSQTLEKVDLLTRKADRLEAQGQWLTAALTAIAGHLGVQFPPPPAIEADEDGFLE